jgi:hypothetical protein
MQLCSLSSWHNLGLHHPPGHPAWTPTSLMLGCGSLVPAHSPLLVLARRHSLLVASSHRLLGSTSCRLCSVRCHRLCWVRLAVAGFDLLSFAPSFIIIALNLLMLGFVRHIRHDSRALSFGWILLHCTPFSLIGPLAVIGFAVVNSTHHCCIQITVLGLVGSEWGHFSW